MNFTIYQSNLALKLRVLYELFKFFDCNFIQLHNCILICGNQIWSELSIICFVKTFPKDFIVNDFRLCIDDSNRLTAGHLIAVCSYSTPKTAADMKTRLLEGGASAGAKITMPRGQGRRLSDYSAFVGNYRHYFVDPATELTLRRFADPTTSPIFLSRQFREPCQLNLYIYIQGLSARSLLQWGVNSWMNYGIVISFFPPKSHVPSYAYEKATTVTLSPDTFSAPLQATPCRIYPPSPTAMTTTTQLPTKQLAPKSNSLPPERQRQPPSFPSLSPVSEMTRAILWPIGTYSVRECGCTALEFFFFFFFFFFFVSKSSGIRTQRRQGRIRPPLIGYKCYSVIMTHAGYDCLNGIPAIIAIPQNFVPFHTERIQMKFYCTDICPPAFTTV